MANLAGQFAIAMVGAALAFAAACGQGEVTPPFSREDLGASSADLPPLGEPSSGDIQLEMIMLTSPTPARAGQARHGGTLRVAWTGPVIRLDPVTTDYSTFASEYHAAAVGSHLFESLLRWDEDGAAQPSLAESWKVSPDGLSYSFELRRGVSFHDAAPLTARAVSLSLDRWKLTGSTQASIVRKFTPNNWLESPDDFTVVASLQQPMPSFIDLLSQPHLSPYVMTEEHAFRQARRPVRDLVGTGPYALAAWRSGESVTIERFRDHVPRTEPASGYAGGQAAWLDRITWVNVPDPDLQLAALLAGEVDVVDGADLTSYGRLLDDQTVRVLRGRPGGNRSVVYLSPASGVFADPLARRAASAAIDVDAAMGSMADEELWSLCPSVYFCGEPPYVRTGEEHYGGLGSESAADLLARSEYGGETVIVLGPSDHPWTAPLVPVVAGALRSAGFRVEEVSADYLTFGGLLRRSGNYTALIGWYGHWAGGSPLTDPTLRPSGRLAPELDSLIELRNRYAIEPDAELRTDLIGEINRLRLEMATAVLLGTFDHMLPVTRDLRGVGLFALPYYGNAWLDR